MAAAALALAIPASAQEAIDQAVAGLRSSPVYVDPGANDVLPAEDAPRIAEEIDKRNAGPLYIVVMPGSIADSFGGDPVGVLREIQNRLGRPGTYAGIIGSHFRAGATGGILERGQAGALATEAFNAHHDDGAAAVLTDFVDRVGAARSGGGGSSGGDASGTGTLILLGLLGAGGGAFYLSRRRRQRRELEQVKHVARDDLVALGDDIRALDMDVAMPDANREAKDHYNKAVEIYTDAEQRFDSARRPEDLEPVSSELERGRYEMVAAKALLAGEPAPERRPPCFFDPRHGPSTRDVEWAPPGGTPRPVPACEADALRVEEGLDPNVREVDYGGERIPYWAAPRMYTPFFGGFYGGFAPFGGFLPGLLVGEMLGGGWGGGSSDPGADQGDGDFGDGGLGDFGGGGGDFGGGDFGGGGDF
ncbi:MAG TPA: LPXTG cell wall anchor domain-containing protein [Thermoleophilaceae bacterium]